MSMYYDELTGSWLDDGREGETYSVTTTASGNSYFDSGYEFISPGRNVTPTWGERATGEANVSSSNDSWRVFWERNKGGILVLGGFLVVAIVAGSRGGRK